MGKIICCKRCGVYPSLDDPLRHGFGAISRVDSKTKICLNCGVQETIDHFRGLTLISKEFWPIEPD